MEKYYLLLGVLGLVFLYLNNKGGYAFALAGTQEKFTPLKNLPNVSSRLFFEGIEAVKEEIGKVGTEVKGLISKLEKDLKGNGDNQEKIKGELEAKHKEQQELIKQMQDRSTPWKLRLKRAV